MMTLLEAPHQIHTINILINDEFRRQYDQMVEAFLEDEVERAWEEWFCRYEPDDDPYAYLDLVSFVEECDIARDFARQGIQW